MSVVVFCFFKQKTAYEMRISDWSSDVCSSDLNAGVRQARNDQWFSQNVPEGVLVALGESPGESEEDVFTWSLSPQFELSEDVMVYARAATGYQPGGPNVALPVMTSSVDSSMLSSYEVGLKSQFAERRVQLDLAAFRIDWDDILAAVQFNGIGGSSEGKTP